MEEKFEDRSPQGKMQKHFLDVMLDEINRSESPRAESLLFTNYVEMLIKDFMELILDTRKGRDVRRDLIVEILEEKKIIDSGFAKDIKLIFKIRDQLAHQVNWILLEHSLNEILSQMKTVKQKSVLIKNWDKKKYEEKVLHVADWAMTVLIQKYENYYQKQKSSKKSQ